MYKFKGRCSPTVTFPKLFGNKQHCSCDVDVCVDPSYIADLEWMLKKIEKNKKLNKAEQVCQTSSFLGRKAKAWKLVPVDLWCPYKSPSIFSIFFFSPLPHTRFHQYYLFLLINQSLANVPPWPRNIVLVPRHLSFRASAPAAACTFKP